MRRIGPVFSLLFLLVPLSAAANPILEKITITIAGHTFIVEVADTPEKRGRGYMERLNIGPQEGMLFVYPGDSRQSFWMKDTPSPLSIAFIDSRGVIREIRDMEPFSQRSVQPQRSVRYALEVRQGRFEELGIVPGDRVEFSGAFPSARE